MKKLIMLIAAVLCAPLMLAAGAVEATPAETAAVIFVSDKGNDGADGLSAGTAMKSFTAAVGKMKTTGGVIVICGRTALSSSACVFPECEGTLTVTSVYGGTDYGASGATLVIPSDLYLSGDTVFENIKLTFASGSKVCCRGNNVTFGSGTVTALVSGNSYPTILGGTDATRDGATVEGCSFYNYTLTVNDGTWNYLTGGNFRNADDHPIGFTGGVKIIINGGTFKANGSSSSDNGVISCGSFCGQDGDYYLEINDGTFSCSVFGVGRCGASSNGKLASYEGDVTIVINGGTFRTQSVTAVQDKKTGRINGDYTLKISGGSFAKTLYMLGAEGVRGRAEAFVPAEMTGYLSSLLPTVYLSAGGNDGADGLSAAAALATLPAAVEKLTENGGVIVLSDGVAVPDGTALAECGGKIRITGGDGGTLDCGGSLAFSCELSIDNITLTGCTALTTDGKSLEIGENVVSDGKTALSCGVGEGSHSLVVRSGKWKSADGGSTLSKDGSVTVHIAGGEISGNVSGARTRYSMGNVSVVLTDGSVGGDIYAAMAGASSASVAICGGSVKGNINPVGNGKIPGEYGVSVFGGELSGRITASENVGAVRCFIAGNLNITSDYESNEKPAAFVADGVLSHRRIRRAVGRGRKRRPLRSVRYFLLLGKKARGSDGDE